MGLRPMHIGRTRYAVRRLDGVLVCDEGFFAMSGMFTKNAIGIAVTTVAVLYVFNKFVGPKL